MDTSIPEPQAIERRGLTRTLVRWLAKRYYPRVEISNADRIPKTGPVLLCANHANSLFDPLLIGVAARRPVRFMAKAPLFDTPVIGPAMSALGMVPAYRGSDDSKQVRRNIESLDIGAKVLVEGSAMGIFPEGKSTDQAHLEMVRSGAARMAIQAAEEGAKAVQVIPIGITYEQKEKFRSSVWIQVGEPIDVDALLKEHDGNVKPARRALTQKLETHLKEVVVHLDEPQWEPWLDDLQTLAEAPDNSEPLPPFQRRKRIADAMNYFLANDRPRTESLADEIKAYRDNVESAGLCVDSPVLRLRGLKVCLELLWHLLCLVFWFIPAAMGTLHHLFPFVLVRGVAARIDQPGRKTVSTNRMIVGVPIYLIWYGVVATWMFTYDFAAWFKWGWLISAPFCGVIAIYYWRRGSRMAQLIWHQLRVTVNRKQLKQLRQQESSLRDRLKSVGEEYATISPRATEIKTPTSGPSKKRRLARALTRTAVVLLVAAIVWVARYALFDDPLSGNGLHFENMSQRRIQSLLRSDEKAMVQLIKGVSELETAATKLQGEFADGSRSFATQKDNDDVRELMRRFLTYRKGLFRIIWKYQRYADIENQQLRLRAFLLDFTAAAELYQASLKFLHNFGDTSEAVAKLNEAEPNWSIEPGLYTSIRHNLANPQNIITFKLAQEYYHQQDVQALFDTHHLSKNTSPYNQFHTAVTAAEATINKVDDSIPERLLEGAVLDMGGFLHDLHYEMQTAVSTWIGDFKIRQPHNGASLIGEKQLAELAAKLQPGDILLERRNWYLSNAFLPGYWPHGAVYVGTADDLKKLGLDQNEYVRKHWEEFSAKDHEGHTHVIIEAVSEGVIFSSLEHSIGGADAVAVLRPNVSEEERLKAIATAFSFAKREYDFEFDFSSTDKLVCTEVVFRAYGGNSGTINFPLERIMGRNTMPANNLVRKFNKEYGTDEAQFEFVAFIDSDELDETSFDANVMAFRASADRPQFSFVHASDRFALKGIGLLGQILLTLTVVAAIVAVVTPLVRRIRSSQKPVENG